MIYWHDLTWEEIKERLREIKAVLLPIGSCEQHGPHLPLGTDTYSVIILSERLAENLKGKVYILPPIWYGISPHHMKFPGTITISPQTLANFVFDIASSLKYHGIQKLVIINGHGGNIPTLTDVLRRIRDELGIEVALVNPWILIGDIIQKVLETDIWGHACEFETSTALVEIPDKIRIDKIRKPTLKIPSVRHIAVWEKNRVITPWNTDEFTDTGSIGDPTKASREKGEILFNAMLERTLEFIKDFIGETEERHES